MWVQLGSIRAPLLVKDMARSARQRFHQKANIRAQRLFYDDAVAAAVDTLRDMEAWRKRNNRKRVPAGIKFEIIQRQVEARPSVNGREGYVVGLMHMGWKRLLARIHANANKRK